MYYNARSLFPKVGELHLECVMFAHSENVVSQIECSESYCALVHYIMLYVRIRELPPRQVGLTHALYRLKSHSVM